MSAAVNAWLWTNRPTLPPDPVATEIAKSPLWSGIIDSNRPVMIVLGDGFMYTHVDPLTGRVQLIRDRAINSSEELRVFLAANPSIAAGRGQRYTSMIQKSTAIGMASVLRLVSHPGREIEVRVRDDLQVDDLQKYDVIYIGPLSRLGPLAGHYELQSRYRYEQKTAGIHDIVTNKSFVPDGDVTVKHGTEYALAARFIGPAGNRIVILTPGGRNSGMLLTVRMFTSEKGLQELEKRLLAFHNLLPDLVRGADFSDLVRANGRGSGGDRRSSAAEQRAQVLTRVLLTSAGRSWRTLAAAFLHVPRGLSRVAAKRDASLGDALPALPSTRAVGATAGACVGCRRQVTSTSCRPAWMAQWEDDAACHILQLSFHPSLIDEVAQDLPS